MNTGSSPGCKRYLTLEGCKFGNACRFHHFQIPSLWTDRISKDGQHPLYRRQFSQHFDQFTRYFSYPQYLQLTSFDALEINELFTRFNEFDWKILLKSQYFIVTSHQDPYSCNGERHILYQCDVTRVCIFILRVLTLHKSSNSELIKSWKTVFNSLAVQNILSTKQMLRSTDIFATELFAIYATNRAESDGKIPLLAYKYYNTRNHNYNWEPLYDHCSACNRSRYKLGINKVFERIPFKYISYLLLHFGDKIKLYPSEHALDKLKFRDKSNNMAEELILFYIWNDYYVEMCRQEIHQFLEDNEIDAHFGSDLFEIIKLYVVDMDYDEFMKGHTHCEHLLMDKKRLKRYIKAIDTFDTNVPRKDRRFWKKYLLNHTITKLFYA